MTKILSVVALCLGVLFIVNGCVSDNRTADQESVVESAVVGQQCGANVCGAGTFCCDSSCGTCLPLGMQCTQEHRCLAGEGTGETDQEVAQPEAEQIDPISGGPIIIGPSQCGSNVCGAGTRCCNASCGTCTPPGVECTQQVCQSPI